MKKITLIVIVVILIIVAIVFIISLNNGSRVEGENEAKRNIQSNELFFESLLSSQDGVEVAVENVIRKDGKTIIELSYNNHQYDLSAMDAVGRSSLAGISPLEYNVINSAMGGHHVQAVMIFKGKLAGELVIGLGELLTFRFNI